ncbi:MAG TPA: hypothetical protein VEK55_03205, partial [Xanthobacteraceae bacterium]|nr:hypothetical protein [Xanthobacteraceae bacterium]
MLEWAAIDRKLQAMHAILGRVPLIGRRFAKSDRGVRVHSSSLATRYCVFCNNSVDAWVPYRIRQSDISDFLMRLETIGSNVERFECPHCASIDRERHLRLFLDRL